jgi:putative flippase GtrA
MNDDTSLNKTAFSATVHCLAGCAIGEVIGMIISTVLNWATAPSIILSIILAFVFGYSLSMLPLMRHKLTLRKALLLALAADTVSIATMELVDNGFILIVPGAISAGLTTVLFWTSLVISLIVAFIAAFPVNRFLISRGKGHAVVHEYHH